MISIILLVATPLKCIPHHRKPLHILPIQTGLPHLLFGRMRVIRDTTSEQSKRHYDFISISSLTSPFFLLVSCLKHSKHTRKVYKEGRVELWTIPLPRDTRCCISYLEGGGSRGRVVLQGELEIVFLFAPAQVSTNSSLLLA